MAPNVLVVEDELAISVTLCEILAQEGYRVQPASSAAEAMERIEHERFDVALLDLRVGEDSGLAILSRLKATSPETVALILTGYGSLETAIQAMRNGALDYLLKPCDVTELKAAIARGLEQRDRIRVATDVEAARTQLEGALRARDDFLALAAHELRTPLSVVIGWAQYLQRQLAESASTETIEKLDVLVGQSRRLARLIEAFIDVVRIQNGTLALSIEPTDLGALVERAVRDAQRAYPDYGIHLKQPGEPVIARADATRIGQVLGGLLDNATKFSSQEGEVEIRVFAERDEARVAVHDQGIGIPPEELPNIFERFYQVERDVMSRRFGGIGLGLFVGRALIEAHNGRIWAESPGSNQGSTFTFALPLARSYGS